MLIHQEVTRLQEFPSATLTAVLAALACMPQLQSLDVSNIPLVAGYPSSSTPRIPSALQLAILEACMSPMHVCLRFGPGELYSGIMAAVVSALKFNTALRHLTVSKPDCMRQENFDPISLAGVEVLTWLESLTLTTDNVDCLHFQKGNQHWLLSPNLSRLTNLTALRFAGCLLQNPKDVATALPSLRNLQVFELWAEEEAEEADILGGAAVLEEADILKYAERREAVAEHLTAVKAILHAAAQLPKLSDLALAELFQPALVSLQHPANIRRLRLHDIWIVEYEDDVLVLYNALQRMHNLEQLSIKARECSTVWLPLLDALETAGTSHSCKQLSLKPDVDDYAPLDPTLVCFFVIACVVTPFKLLAVSLFAWFCCVLGKYCVICVQTAA